MPSPCEDDDGVIRALVDRLGHDLEPSILIGGAFDLIDTIIPLSKADQKLMASAKKS